MGVVVKVVDDDPDEPPPREGGRLEVRVIEMAHLGAASFHPKAWCFAGPDLAAAFVGNSNISHAALRDGKGEERTVGRAAPHALVEHRMEAFETEHLPVERGRDHR